MTKKRRLGLMPPWQRLLAWCGLTICTLSGCAYLIGHTFGVLAQQIGNHTVLVLHGVSAAGVVFLLGTVATVHIKAGLVAKKSLCSGFFQLFVLVLLVSTGLLLYYGTEETRDFTVWSHWILGLSFVPVFVVHASKR
jgi:hypothetical protein